MKGRGIDYHVSEMDNYHEMKKELEKIKFYLQMKKQ